MIEIAGGILLAAAALFLLLVLLRNPGAIVGLLVSAVTFGCLIFFVVALVGGLT